MPGGGIKVLGQVVGFQFHPRPAVPGAPQSLSNEVSPGCEQSSAASQSAGSQGKGSERAQMGLMGPKRKALPAEVAEQPQLLQVSEFIVN